MERNSISCSEFTFKLNFSSVFTLQVKISTHHRFVSIQQISISAATTGKNVK